MLTPYHLPITALATLTGAKAATIRLACVRGDIPSERLGTRYFATLADVQAFMADPPKRGRPPLAK